MYKQIAKHPPTLEIYSKKLVGEKVVSEKELTDMQESVSEVFEVDFLSSFFFSR